jgi:hypothetical protein
MSGSAAMADRAAARHELEATAIAPAMTERRRVIMAGIACFPLCSTAGKQDFRAASHCVRDTLDCI